MSVIVGLGSLPVGLIARLIPSDVFFFWIRCLPDNRRPPPEFRTVEPLTRLSASDTDFAAEGGRPISVVFHTPPSGRISPGSRRSDGSQLEGTAAQLSFFRNLRGGRVYGAEAQSITSFRSDGSPKPDFYTTPAIRRWNVVQNAVQDGSLKRKALDQAKLNMAKAAARISEEGDPNRPPPISLNISDFSASGPPSPRPRMADVVVQVVEAQRETLRRGVSGGLGGLAASNSAAAAAAVGPLLEAIQPASDASPKNE